MAVAGIARNVPLPDQRVQGTAEGLAADSEFPLQLDKANTTTACQEREDRCRPAVVEERNELRS